MAVKGLIILFADDRVKKSGIKPLCPLGKGKIYFWRSTADLARLHSNAVASPVSSLDTVGLHRMRNDCAHFEHAQNKRHGSGF